MRKELIAAASVLALAMGAAHAQTTPAPGPSTQEPGVTQGPLTQDGMTMLPREKLGDLMGKTLVGEQDEEIGSIDDVILGPDGKAQQIIAASGGFLGIGEKKIAIEASRVLMEGDGDTYRVSGMTQQDVEQMPEFEMKEGMTALSQQED